MEEQFALLEILRDPNLGRRSDDLRSRRCVRAGDGAEVESIEDSDRMKQRGWPGASQVRDGVRPLAMIRG
jgi:hypothetical protein